MRKVEKIELLFENCETMMFSASDLESIGVTGISKSVRCVGEDSIVEMKTCKLFYMKISPTANRQHIPFGVEEIGTTTTFERICLCHDIVSVCFVYDDGERDEIFVPWKDGVGVFGTENACQINQRTTSGSLLTYILEI